MGKRAVTGVRIFDGQELTEPRTVVIEGEQIGVDAEGAEVFDAAGGVLLPGLIDAHVHLRDRGTLEELREHGVTTALDMGTWPAGRVDALRGLAGLPDVRTAGTPALGEKSPHLELAGMPADAVVDDPAGFVAARIADGADYIKVFVEAPGEGGPEHVDVLVAAAREAGRRVVAHALSPEAFRAAVASGADVITHVPLGEPVENALLARMANAGQAAVPTLTMMQGIAEAVGEPESYEAAARTVLAMHEAGITVLAGTDANGDPDISVNPPFGESIHREMELLVAAGLTPAEVLRATTALPARRFGLFDRGAVRPGLRADLVLIDGDPLADISATRNVRRVWCGGVEHVPAGA
ncbi:amidohydrolase family protein [Actinomadura atramentaria]|uniref:amidohydrolase family protein n=1 Tax=Actinomadura atramentaria TaxID=1990 RepID=UPI0003A1BD90|nr:amidohydrolase family protein [Actinomadura atramentaria]